MSQPQDDAAKALKEYLSNHMYGGKPPEKKEEVAPAPAPEPAPEPEKKEEVPEVKADAPEKKEEPAPKPRRRERVDTTKIAEEAATLAAERVAKEIKETQPAPAPAPAPAQPDNPQDISEEYAERLEVMEFMAKRNAKYADLPKKYRNFIIQEAEYIKRWEKENPGSEYAPDATEHNAFYEKHLPEYSEVELNRSRIALEAERAAEAKFKETESRLSKIDEEKAAASLFGDIRAERMANLKAVSESIQEGGFSKFDTQAAYEATSQEDPLLVDVVMRNATAIAQLTDAVVLLYRADGKIKEDPKNPVHRELTSIAENLERSIANLPSTQRKSRDGKSFATRQAWLGMSESQRSNYWFIGEQELLFAIRAQAEMSAKEEYEAEKARLERYMKRHGKPDESAPQPAPAPAKVAKPSASSDKVVTQKPGGQQPVKTFQQILGERMFGGKG